MVFLTHIPQDYYACVDLIDSCFRMNIVALAEEMMEERPITSYADLHQLVLDLLAMTNTWSKYEWGSLKDCPDLAQPKVVRLEEAPLVTSIIDIDIDGCPPPKQQKPLSLDEEDSSASETSAGDEEAATIADVSDCPPTEAEQPLEGSDDQYREYMLGKYT